MCRLRAPVHGNAPTTIITHPHGQTQQMYNKAMTTTERKNSFSVFFFSVYVCLCAEYVKELVHSFFLSLTLTYTHALSFSRYEGISLLSVQLHTANSTLVSERHKNGVQVCVCVCVCTSLMVVNYTGTQTEAPPTASRIN